MKDMISIQDYLFSLTDVGDWEGEEELIADRINTIYHAVWAELPDDISIEQTELLLTQLWNELRGGMVLLEADEDELVDWALAYVCQQLDEGMPGSHTNDEEE